MARWDWLTKPICQYNWRFVGRVVGKATLLFVLVNIVYVLVQPLPLLGQVTLYNNVLPGRSRIPYADNPSNSYNVTLSRVESMLASHGLAAASRNHDDTFRVFLIGDSSVWGWLLDEDETFEACLNRADIRTDDGRRLEVYNLGFPLTNSLKDLLILDYAMRYQPDAIVWFMTLEGMFRGDQLSHPILQSNAQRVTNLIQRYDLSLEADELMPAGTLLERTLFGQRRELADLLRHQVYGLAYATTQTDHTPPGFTEPPMRNLPESEGLPNRPAINTPSELEDALVFDLLRAGSKRADMAGVPLMLVNEPIYISDGVNSDLRYNKLYPRWAYDAYRELLSGWAESVNRPYVDLWDFVPAQAFTDALPLHYNAEWTCNVAEEITPRVLQLAE